MTVGETFWKADDRVAEGPATDVRAIEALEKSAARASVNGYMRLSESSGRKRSEGPRRRGRGRAEICAATAAIIF